MFDLMVKLGMLSCLIFGAAFNLASATLRVVFSLFGGNLVNTFRNGPNFVSKNVKLGNFFSYIFLVVQI